MSAEHIAQRVEILASGFRSLEQLLQKPFHIRDKGNVETYRFGNPRILQFITLHFGQTISHWNVLCVLVELGFQYETMIISRSIFEAELKIRYILSGVNGDKIDRKQQRFIERYFADNKRWDNDQRSRKTTPQKQVIEENALSFQKDLKLLRDWRVSHSLGEDAESIEAPLRDFYRIGSNFAHGRYPELMFFYEGDNPVFSSGGLRDPISSKTVDEMVSLFLDGSLKLLVTSIMKLITAGYIDKFSKAAEWALFDSSVESEEIELIKAVWNTRKK